MRTRVLVALSISSLALALGLACSQPPSEDSRAEASPTITVTDAASDSTPAKENLAVPSTEAAAPIRLIRTADLLIREPDVDGAVARIERKVGELGGYVAASQVNHPADDRVTAELTARVPPENFEVLLRYLQDGYQVEQLRSDTDDVSEKYVDLQSRLKNKKRQEERLLQILSTRTGSISELTQMEREVARVREEVELLEGKLRLLDSRTRLSTVTMRLVTPAAAPVTARFGGDYWGAVAGAFTSSSGALKVGAQYGLMAGAYLLPFATVLALLIIAVKVLARLRGVRHPAA